MTADFPEKIDSFRGLQISHYLRTPGDDGLILETWFNPVGAQALFMPGWFRDHYRNMRRYDHMACTGSVVGTRPDGRVSLDWRGRMKLTYDPHPDDLKRLVAGLKLAGRIHLAAGADAGNADDVPVPALLYPRVAGRARRAGSGQHGHHCSTPRIPQGGNAISRNRTRGVVDPDFSVPNAPGVYVCDASVFPAAITVNPQLTVMALAEYAAERIE